MMHGQKTIKLCNAEQAKQVYQYKNTKNSPLLIGAMYGSIQSVTIPDTVNIQLSS
jgi:hypothetical protein